MCLSSNVKYIKALNILTERNTLKFTKQCYTVSQRFRKDLLSFFAIVTATFYVQVPVNTHFNMILLLDIINFELGDSILDCISLILSRFPLFRLNI